MSLCPRCKTREREGKRAYCKECQREYAREYYAKHSKECLERNKKWRAKSFEDPEKYKAHLEYERKYRQAHKDEYNSWSRGYRAYKKMLWDQQKKEIDAVKGLLHYAANYIAKES